MGGMGDEVQEGLGLWAQEVAGRTILLHASKCWEPRTSLPRPAVQLCQELFRPARSQHSLGRPFQKSSCLSPREIVGLG